LDTVSAFIKAFSYLLADLMRLGAPPGMKMSSVEEAGQSVIQVSLGGDCLEVDFYVRT
jgi:hypothetical protein